MSTQALKAAAKGEATPQEARNPYEHLKRQLENSRGEFAKLVGSTANAEKFIRVVLNAVLANPALMDASRSSLIAACMRCAQDGLMPDGREAVLNIYSVKIKGNERDTWEQKAQYLPMVGGLVKKLYAGGDVTYVDATVVYEGDHFRFVRGDEPKLEHEPKGQTASVLAAYCVVKLKNGETKREVMWMRDIEKVRAASKSADTGPWKTWFEEMAIKSVIKRIYKQLPHADAFEALAQYDNEAMGYTGLGESAAAIAERALHENDPRAGQPQVEHQPGEVLEQAVGNQAERVDRSEADSGEARFKEAISDDKQLGTALEVSLRAAKSKDALDLSADRIREIKDEAIRLRLTELYEAEAAKFKESKE
jgi:recombination protein RecT